MSGPLHVLERKLKSCVLPLYDPYLPEGTFPYNPEQMEMFEAHYVRGNVSTTRRLNMT